ncbi:hypothetical protein 10RS306A_gene4611 [Ralstonia phage 10RS306A]|uniref:Uncharacterized protein n=1 Tax=Ralstonia phage 10RS306A TaxID=2968818 RepID=A0A977TEH0_9CAUD|nr:hypothetical protein 10RS306A_gene4611 [Ralstonia phage 10RS306A]
MDLLGVHEGAFLEVERVELDQLHLSQRVLGGGHDVLLAARIRGIEGDPIGGAVDHHVEVTGPDHPVTVPAHPARVAVEVAPVLKGRDRAAHVLPVDVPAAAAVPANLHRVAGEVLRDADEVAIAGSAHVGPAHIVALDSDIVHPVSPARVQVPRPPHVAALPPVNIGFTENPCAGDAADAELDVRRPAVVAVAVDSRHMTHAPVGPADTGVRGGVVGHVDLHRILAAGGPVNVRTLMAEVVVDPHGARVRGVRRWIEGQRPGHQVTALQDAQVRVRLGGRLIGQRGGSQAAQLLGEDHVPSRLIHPNRGVDVRPGGLVEPLDRHRVYVREANARPLNARCVMLARVDLDVTALGAVHEQLQVVVHQAGRCRRGRLGFRLGSVGRGLDGQHDVRLVAGGVLEALGLVAVLERQIAGRLRVDAVLVRRVAVAECGVPRSQRHVTGREASVPSRLGGVLVGQRGVAVAECGVPGGEGHVPRRDGFIPPRLRLAQAGVVVVLGHCVLRIDRITKVHDAAVACVEVAIVVRAQRVRYQIAGFLCDVDGLEFCQIQVSGPQDRGVVERHQSILGARHAADLDVVVALRGTPCGGRANLGCTQEGVLAVLDQFAPIRAQQGHHDELTGQIVEVNREVLDHAIQRIDLHGCWSSHVCPPYWLTKKRPAPEGQPMSYSVG